VAKTKENGKHTQKKPFTDEETEQIVLSTPPPKKNLRSTQYSLSLKKNIKIKMKTKNI
jgi:hypothetical protein